MRKITILGSTGSVGKEALKVASHHRNEMEIFAISGRHQVEHLFAQACAFRPRYVVIWDEQHVKGLQSRLPFSKVLSGLEGLNFIASESSVDCVVGAMSGLLGLEPIIHAIKAKKRVALANKEILVSAGALIMGLIQKNGAELLPVDSEHSALFQCLLGEKRQEVKRLILTASGGPFRTFSREQLETVTLEDALKHPTWSMGAKVSIDSSTLMNKGLEVIQAHFLFDIPHAQIEVVVHPQSIIQSMVEFQDGQTKALLGLPSLVAPLQYALMYPKRERALLPSHDFTKNMTLEFFPPDTRKFTCLRLCMEALQSGGSYTCYLNGANEILVERFLKKEISWSSIGKKLDVLIQKHHSQPLEDLDTILSIDSQSRLDAALI